MDNSSSVRRMKPLLGTFVEVGTFDNESDAQKFSAVFEVIEQIHNLLSFHDPNSDLSKLNSSTGDFVELNRLSIRALKLAKAIAKRTDDKFNPTVGGELVSRRVLPKHRDKDLAVVRIGRNSDLEIKGSSARLVRPVLITLDGIAKGLAVDLGIEKMKVLKFKSGWINAGGDLRVFGNYKLPIHRRVANGSFENLGELQDAALATSQVRPKPLKDFNSWIVAPEISMRETSVCTVVAKKAWRADALTKVAAMPGNELLIAKLGALLVAPT